MLDEDEADQRNFEVQKLLRAPRYFDDVYEPKGVACWRCGKRGHLAKDCSLSAAKPCYYCAQYGHEPFSCPHRLCFRCGEPGHMTKDCSLQRGQVKGGGRGLCLRCGRAECAAADYSDWFRCNTATGLRAAAAMTTLWLTWTRCAALCAGSAAI